MPKPSLERTTAGKAESAQLKRSATEVVTRSLDARKHQLLWDRMIDLVRSVQDVFITEIDLGGKALFINESPERFEIALASGQRSRHLMAERLREPWFKSGRRAANFP